MFDRLIAMIAISAALAAPANAGQVSHLERFQLWNECRPLNLIVKHEFSIFVPEELRELAKRRIKPMVRRRLQAARIYGSEDRSTFVQEEPVLSISLEELLGRRDWRSRPYGDSRSGIEFNKRLHDPLSGKSFESPTWSVDRSHSSDADEDEIMLAMSEMIDTFTGHYLRVNASMCQ